MMVNKLMYGCGVQSALLCLQTYPSNPTVDSIMYTYVIFMGIHKNFPFD